MTGPRILALGGSLRRASLNARLLAVAAGAAREAGAEVTEIDLRGLALPLYDPELETAEGLPEGARRLKALMGEHRGLLLASPEHNSAFSAALKNAVDWASRPLPGEAGLASFDGKVAALLAASPGALGGLRGLAALRTLLGNIRVLVIPEQFALVRAHEAFDEGGALKDPKQAAAVAAVARRLVEVTGRMHPG